MVFLFLWFGFGEVFGADDMLACYDRHGRCASEVLCTAEGGQGCERDSEGWVRILRIR